VGSPICIWKLPQLFPEIKKQALERGAILPVVVALFAWPDLKTLAVLSAVNALLYGVELWKHGRNPVLTRCWLGSLALLVTTVSFNQVWVDNRTTSGGVALLTLLIYACLYCLTTRNPKVALLGSCSATILSALWADQMQISFYHAAQIGFIFLLFHSLVWNDADHSGAGLLRVLASVGWMLTSLFWVKEDGMQAAWFITGAGLGVILTGLLVGWIRHQPYPWVVIGSGIAVILVEQGYAVVLGLKNAPTGLVTLVSSFLLFALGIGIALWKGQNPLSLKR
jgi:hypothetical protein